MECFFITHVFLPLLPPLPSSWCWYEIDASKIEIGLFNGFDVFFLEVLRDGEGEIERCYGKNITHLSEKESTPEMCRDKIFTRVCSKQRCTRVGNYHFLAFGGRGRERHNLCITSTYIAIFYSFFVQHQMYI